MEFENSAGRKLTIRQVAHGSPDYWATVGLRDSVLRKPLGLGFSPEELQAETIPPLRRLCGDRLVACLVLYPLEQGDVR